MLKIEGTANIGTKGQIVIPKQVRDKFKLNIGNDLVVLSGDFGIFLVKSSDLRDMIGDFSNLIEMENLKK